MKKILVTVTSFVLLVIVKGDMTRLCQNRKMTIECSCGDISKIFVSSGEEMIKTNNTTTFSLSTCASATVNMIYFLSWTDLRSIRIENIKGDLNFEVDISSMFLEEIKIFNVGKIPKLDRFTTVRNLTRFHIENTTIENFDETFKMLNVTDFILKNVIINNVRGLKFSERGKSMEIHNCIIKIVNPYNYFEFERVNISNSRFEFLNQTSTHIHGQTVYLRNNSFQYGEKKISRSSTKFMAHGNLQLHGQTVELQNNVVVNAAVSVSADQSTSVIGTCADGSSSLLIDSKNISISSNKLPTPILYNSSNLHLRMNNSECNVGKCKCQTSLSAVNVSNGKCNSSVWIAILLPLFMYKL